jgi:hypothetical protein
MPSGEQSAAGPEEYPRAPIPPGEGHGQGVPMAHPERDPWLAIFGLREAAADKAEPSQAGRGQDD